MHRYLVLLAVYGGWTLLVAHGAGANEGASSNNAPDAVSTHEGRTRPTWQPERPARSVSAEATAPPLREQADQEWPTATASDRLGQSLPAAPDALVANEWGPDEPEVILPGGGVYLEPLDDESPLVDQGAPWIDRYGVEYPDPAIGAGSPLGEEVYDEGWWPLARNLLVFAGVHGFKGPTDLGRNGNFGFHEGLNWGAPLGDLWGYGYQVGFQAVHSNFAGHQALQTGPLSHFDTADRNQVFVTAGLFRRPVGGGLQAGTAFDLFYDSYYDQSTLQQIRSETALVLGDLREIGYWGAYGLSKEKVTGFGQFDTLLDPTDLFALFYRRRFTGGGRGRLWAGVSGNGDAIFGLDGTVPLGTSWALDNNFTCLFPKQGPRSGGQGEESWSVSIQLVWFPGRPARHVLSNRYHPLFYVADNSWFLVDRRR